MSNILTNTENGYLIITINRPDKLNALNKIVFDELDLVLNEIESNSEIRSAYITGTGAKAFVAGADITEFDGLSKEQSMAMSKKGQDVFFRIENSSKPIIAAVNGFALGGGCELAMACHFRIAADNAKFGQPEVNLGLIPGYGGTQRLTQLIGKGRAIEMLISANMIDAQTALQYGLVNYVVSPAELLDKTKSILETINSKAPLAIGKCIDCANIAGGDGGISPGGYTKETEAFGECFVTEDKKEGTAAFLEKRKAEFRGK
ncbi:MAG: enoyl-CoA hydratase-related protein [Chitinophagaceae bacterium]